MLFYQLRTYSVNSKISFHFLRPMEEPASSLYGPGAIICWLCTALSVFLSWNFNRSNRRSDTITIDVAACLALPGIAIVHLLCELCRAEKTKDWKATQTMDATCSICMYFAPFGTALSYLAYLDRNKRRFFLTILVTLACESIVLVVLTTNGSKIPFFDEDNAFLPLILSIFILPPTTYLLVLRGYIFANVHRISIYKIVLSVCWSIFQELSLGALVRIKNSRTGGGKDRKTSHLNGRVLPQTPYLIGDIDQAVALSIGIVTLLISIRDIITDFNFSAKDEFEYWRVRCLENIELGNAEMEVARWKQELEVIDRKAKCERTRARHRKREQETYENLPKVVKHCLDKHTIPRRFEEVGFL
jgi:hypothetical protein